MKHSNRLVLLVISDSRVLQPLVTELLRRDPDLALPVAVNLAQARSQLRRLSPPVVVLDESAVPVGGNPSLDRAARDLARVAPVVLLAGRPFTYAQGPERESTGDRGPCVSKLDDLRSEDRIDIVWKGGEFLSRAAAFVESRLDGVSLAATPADQLASEIESVPEDFGEVLRHEVNNPLTGILGNAELLLARRDALPPAAVQRLQTIADLAVRLRETVRRLSCAWSAAGGRPAANRAEGPRQARSA